jgi:histidinol phosphatase-like PHP family hydrolase
MKLANLRCDFHTHTSNSDGDLLPIELIRRAYANGYKAIAITDHVSLSNVEEIVRCCVIECKLAMRNWDIIAIPGVEITHVPPEEIKDVVKLARKAGAKIVNVHGETPVEPVAEGTNLAAVKACCNVLCHPGFITEEVAEIAKKNKVYIEITSRQGHSYTNGHVVKVGLKEGVSFLLNSDTHEPEDMIDFEFSKKVAKGAGLDEEECMKALIDNPKKLLARLGF